MSTILSSMVDSAIWTRFIAKVITVLCCFPVHECAHAWTAMKYGDYTGKREGRITLNPLVHLDLWGTLMIFAFGFGYAKPVPVSARNLRNPKRDMAFVALAGPVSNLLMAIILMALGKVIYLVTMTSRNYYFLTGVLSFIRYAAYINVNLAIFNLIPVPPLDGFQAVRSLLPDSANYKIAQFRKYSVYILFGLVIVCGYLGISPITAVAGKIYGALLAIFG